MTAGINGNDEQTRMVSLPDVLSTLSHEARVLADGLNELQTVIGDLLAAGELRGSQGLYELQSLDRLSQSLEAISECLNGVSKQSSADWKIDIAEAARHIKLSDISDRLHGNASSGDTPSDGTSGDFEDFSLTG